MKRELKDKFLASHNPIEPIARPIPMKRELKEKPQSTMMNTAYIIARPIPMKRELKEHQAALQQWMQENRKAHPDEKGTESESMARLWGNAQNENRKAHPDEKGTESKAFLLVIRARNMIARPIPMKRELKVFVQTAYSSW